ncbi:DinB family protein [Rhodocytophaga aerolata]|uniref:DinB family protein n=1 Tax=Rhodocytophaga aerolata TaxID=455078 RepID=A0ABT8RLC8_9BACT|nr:DinB family protein [Rhodocytophaga aerolata]MDO1451887.1 DinB family protein [Rhodocytophaga aerolata]
MNIHKLIQEIRNTLSSVFAEVDEWFDKPEEVRTYRPINNGWTINEILEHISLTSHFLLKLIDKGTTKALKNTNGLDLTAELENYVFERDKLDEIGIYKSFAWIRPQHMEPTGQVSLAAIRNTIREQKEKCMAYLDSMPNGEGVLYRTTMSVNNLGKIDVYEYIYFLAKHAQRHIGQMERNEREMKSQHTTSATSASPPLNARADAKGEAGV